jgi:hypothetical protein
MPWSSRYAPALSAETRIFVSIRDTVERSSAATMAGV